MEGRIRYTRSTSGFHSFACRFNNAGGGTYSISLNSLKSQVSEKKEKKKKKSRTTTKTKASKTKIQIAGVSYQTLCNHSA